MPGRRLVPATLSFADGIPYSESFGDVYHSADGGLAQARHVYIGGNRLPQRWAHRPRFVILETGFGLGLNFLATWHAWRADPSRPEQLHYIAIEKHPFSAADLHTIHGLWPELAEVAHALRACWPPLVPGFHRLLLDEGRVVLTLVFGDIADCLPEIHAAADAFYLDGFAPSKNPDMWAPAILTRLNRLAAPDATLATYSIASAVRAALTQAGFVCERVPGFGRKPEMLAARFAPRWPQPARAEPVSRRALVIGAGIAGSAACERLAARGWQVTLIERHAAPAQEASGNLAGIVMPLLSRDDNLASRLARAAYLFTLHLWGRLGGAGRAFDGAACGVLQLAADARQALLQQATLADSGFPEDYARWADPSWVAGHTGNVASHGGWFFPHGGWVTPASLCDALLAACDTRLNTRFGQTVTSLQRIGYDWVACNESGAAIAQAPVVVIASGAGASLLPQTQALPLQAIRGQVTHLPPATMTAPSIVICGEGYVTPVVQGICPVGASYDFDVDKSLRASSHAENLQRLTQLLPQAHIPDEHAVQAAGRVGFRSVAPDRLPLIGALPDPSAAIAGTRLRDVPRLPGLYGLLGYASRGLIWAPFAAELLVASLEGEPLPIEQSLLDAVDPARFALKAYRRDSKELNTD
ncbi:bifunctional tRNA (5-methylaminomethyl-2-thiouridine)(34)-methyltransferase MnmD/FAD-dependent 5-carboxymethylaminomethyl-2-thiouridine(34) oxidoreductase MnmC [Noviherbaspirillum saxi]|uniref:tRNA 5-methylaminomethyl-2-thiouridine biosynthesis bifunctional protein MnmC n=1 Tax=Noviherbaspirillum saxi TaxID=2320863 RepID=A0A3A3FPM0_9BURK|nr:bifunctional tRNA (5-methylaminomethyl-2-thiouridine)(34)-methyltransferase MnmD/FAD-dependent 5-carboxymethylaminomethyl-2-thiouridine(34) oxidoreductase MnmC [Noviherbaspirillum saxi]RJF97410.1 bifunctional tRNA (5-methylaminomethyl-2-thiouridine)(34)-methyltransferase MnmD/FAD-dependent 5-carboxymethylaminomethyl-2-thiouridine(34) oxidoreductase MnmC [Noviherbaspirillum saxi]